MAAMKGHQVLLMTPAQLRVAVAPKPERRSECTMKGVGIAARL